MNRNYDTGNQYFIWSHYAINKRDLRGDKIDVTLKNMGVTDRGDNTEYPNYNDCNFTMWHN